ncbi:MAG: ComEA family DNA-binding protein [Pseudomonas sp.]|nr:ComEA family DNA-binding protein [Pseudomonas sp.]
MRKLMINTILAAALSAGSFLAIAAEPQAAAQTQIVATIDQPRVNINTADIETLARELNGIGAAKARAIVEYREENGSFASVDELIEVKGIGVAIMEKNLHELTVE